MCRGSIHSVSLLAVSLRPPPSTPLKITSTALCRPCERSYCALSSASRRRGSWRAYAALEIAWPTSADSSMGFARVGRSGGRPEWPCAGEMLPRRGQRVGARGRLRGSPPAERGRRRRARPGDFGREIGGDGRVVQHAEDLLELGER